MASNIISTVQPMLGGSNASAGVGGIATLTVTGTWVTGETFNALTSIVANGRTVQFGNGAVTDQDPVYVLTYKKKVYLFGPSSLFFVSALQLPTIFNDPNAAGRGFQDLSNESGYNSALKAAAVYQGKLAVFSRETVSIVAVDPDPANNQVVQTLENIGTVNGRSVRGIGDLDVLFCADSGFRSLRARDASSNAAVMDVGTPIDTLVVARLASIGATVMASVVEPNSSRYWCSIGNLIYVFSYFASSGVIAWSFYTPQTVKAPDSGTYNGSGQVTYSGLIPGQAYWFDPGGDVLQFDSGTATATPRSVTPVFSTATVAGGAAGGPYPGVLLETFTPEKMELYNGAIYVRSTLGKVYQYGGSNGNTYDASPCAWETPWLDAKSAATSKLGSGMDAGLEGGWALSLGMDPVSAVLKEIYRNNVSSFSRGVIPSTMKGTHFKVRGVTTGAEYARFSSFAFHFAGGDSR